MTANHRGKDSVAIENGDQILLGRFTYGPLDVVSLSGEKVDVYINNMVRLEPFVHIQIC